MKFLFDTDHLSLLQRRSGPDYAVLSLRMSHHPRHDFALCVVSVHEQSLGANNFIKRSRKKEDVVKGYLIFERILESYKSCGVLAFNDHAATTEQSLKAIGVRLPTMDFRIASIALSNGLTLLTRNRRDFSKVPGLVIEDWTV